MFQWNSTDWLRDRRPHGTQSDITHKFKGFVEQSRRQPWKNAKIWFRLLLRFVWEWQWKLCESGKDLWDPRWNDSQCSLQGLQFLSGCLWTKCVRENLHHDGHKGVQHIFDDYFYIFSFCFIVTRKTRFLWLNAYKVWPYTL